jgi:hypothetical protein
MAERERDTKRAGRGCNGPIGAGAGNVCPAQAAKCLDQQRHAAGGIKAVVDDQEIAGVAAYRGKRVVVAVVADAAPAPRFEE